MIVKTPGTCWYSAAVGVVAAIVTVESELPPLSAIVTVPLVDAPSQ